MPLAISAKAERKRRKRVASRTGFADSTYRIISPTANKAFAEHSLSPPRLDKSIHRRRMSPTCVLAAWVSQMRNQSPCVREHRSSLRTCCNERLAAPGTDVTTRRRSVTWIGSVNGM